MELIKVDDISECMEQLEIFGPDLPLAEIFTHHMKLVIKMQLTEYTFYRVEESGTSGHNPPLIISVCADRVKPEYQLIFHEQDTSLVKDALTTLVDWTKTNIFFPLHIPQIPVLSDVASHHGAAITEDIRCHTFILRNLDDLPALKMGADVSIRPLTTDDAEFINSQWEYREEDSEVIIRRNLEMCPGYGAYSGDDRLVSWVLLRGHGSMSYLHTIPEARRRGYALMVVNKLARHILSIGLTPMADVIDGNTASTNLFSRKLGFQKVVANTDLITSATEELNI